MDLSIFIFLTVVALTVSALAGRNLAFAAAGGILFILIGIVALQQNVTQTYFFYNESSGTIVNQTVVLLSHPFDTAVPVFYVLLGVTVMLVGRKARSIGGWSYG